MKFSIIIPAHNSELFIRKALESVRIQTFKDYELIVICDSCTDNTEAVAREYGATTYTANFHRDGLARNAGIDHASGDWLLFMDDDDWWIHECVLELLVGKVGKQNEDILRFSFIWKGRGYAGCGDYYAVWNKCWRRSFVGKTRFSDVENWSDVDFHRAMMAKQPKIIDWDMPLYYYNFMREGSISWRNVNS